MTIQDRVNNNLSALFDVDDDPIYKAFICDKDGTNPSTVTTPTDIDIGVITSQIEYLRRLSVGLAKQIFIDQADHTFLKFVLEEFFDSLQLENETDAEWVQRTIDIVFNQKLSRAAIIFAMRPFSDAEPVITTTGLESAYADFSYADIYVKDEYVLGSETIFILPAITEDYQSGVFAFKLILTNTSASDIYTVLDLLDKIVAAGILVVLQIEYT